MLEWVVVGLAGWMFYLIFDKSNSIQKKMTEQNRQEENLLDKQIASANIKLIQLLEKQRNAPNQVELNKFHWQIKRLENEIDSLQIQKFYFDRNRIMNH
jgi:uncharacterized protein Yka (UPF0111/DUF47 family)